MSIPLVFVPQSHQGFRTYDGGIKYNYPVDKLLEDLPGTKFIGLYLGTAIYEGIERTSVLADIVSIVMESPEPDDIEKYRDSTVIIDTRPIITLDFSLNDKEKDFLLQTGRTAALAHLDDKNEEYATAVRKRDELKKAVEDARSAAALKRRQRRRWTMGLLLLLIGGIAKWWLWSNGARTKSNGGTPEPRTDSVSTTKDSGVTPLERAKLAATLLPQITSKDVDVVAQAEMLGNAVATGTLDHATAIDIAPTLVKRGLSNEHFLRVVSPSVPYALDRVAARGLQLLSDWEQLGETPGFVYRTVDGIKPELLPVVKERDVWRQAIADRLSRLPSPSRSDLTKQVRGLYFLMQEFNEPALTEVFRNPHRTIRLVGALNCVIQSWGPRKEAASAISAELSSLDMKNVDDLSFVGVLLDLLVVYGVKHDKQGTWTDTSISPALAESLAKLAVDGTFRHRVAWIPDAASAEDREKWFAEEKAALKHSSVCFRAGELLNLMKTRSENAEAVLIAHLDEFCREVNSATDGTALNLLASRYGKHSVRFAVSVLGALGTPNANAAIRKIRDLGQDKLRSFEGVHWELEALDRKNK